MRGHRPPFSIGIEEEYHLVDRKTRDVVSDPPRHILSECAALLHEDQVHPELLRSQIEVETRVCHTVREAIEDLAGLRRTVAKVTEQYGLAPVAASTLSVSL